MGRNEAAIHKEHERDRAAARYQGIRDADAKLKNRIDWEHATEDAIQRRNVARLAQGIEAQRDDRLQGRRQRLADLLAADDAQLRHELSALTETPQERRARLQEKATQLRQDHERRRLEFVEQQRRRQFRANTDELRTAGDRKLMLACDRDRRHQLERKALAKVSDDLEQRKWERLWRQQTAQDQERERLAHERKKADDARVYDDIADQLEAIHAERERQRRAKEAEAHNSLRIMQDEAQKELERQRRYQERAAQQRAEIERYNGDVQAARAEAQLRKQRDGPELASLPALMTETDDGLVDRKRQLVADQRDFLAYRHEQQRQQRVREADLEALRQAELERRARRQDLAWEKEQLARDKLLREVVGARQMQLLEKAEMARRERQLQSAHGSGCLLAASEDPMEAVAARRAQFADALNRQIAERQFRAEMERAARHYETLEAQIAEQEYQERLRAELDADAAALKI